MLRILFMLLATSAWAQQPQTSLDQALAIKLSAEVNASLQCTAANIDLQKQLAAMTKERDDLKAKYEPSK